MPLLYFSPTMDAAQNTAFEQTLLELHGGASLLYLYSSEACAILPREGGPDALCGVRRLSRGLPFLGDPGALGYAFITDESRFSLAVQQRVLMDALQYVDLSAQVQAGRLLVHGLPCSESAVYRAGQSMLHHGAIYIRVPSERLAEAERLSGIHYANLAQFHPALQKSYLCSAIRYAFECAFGKASWFTLPEENAQSAG